MTPEQTKFALTLRDGSVAIMSFVTKGFNPNGSVQFEREPTDEHLRRDFAKHLLDVVSYRPIADTDLPTRDYRNAWCDDGTRITHDMAKARDICRERLRALRAPLLAELDVEYQRADEREDAAAKRDVATRKQRLRDATKDPRIEAAADVSDLDEVLSQLSGVNAEQGRREQTAKSDASSMRGDLSGSLPLAPTPDSE